MKKKLIFLLITGLTVLFSLTACGKSSKSPQPEAIQGTQQGDKIPEQLKSIENNIEKIILTLKGPAVSQEEGKGKDKDKQKNKTESTQQGSQQSSAKQGSEDQGDSDKEGTGGGQKKSQGQGDQGSQGGKGQGTQQAKQPEKPEDPWETITPLINDMHYKWNSYMPMAAKKGAGKTLLDSFGNSLNSLTNTIISKNSTNTLMAASMLYANIPDFYSLYRTNVSPEIKRIRYYTRNAMLNGYTSNWTQADSDMNNLKSIWSLYKNTATKDNQDNYNKLDFSIYELDKAIIEKNQPITDIKGRVAMSNIQSLEKSMSKGTSGGQGESQSEGSSAEGSSSESSTGGGSSGGENSSESSSSEKS